jgi:hypothetical protein
VPEHRGVSLQPQQELWRATLDSEYRREDGRRLRVVLKAAACLVASFDDGGHAPLAEMELAAGHMGAVYRGALRPVYPPLQVSGSSLQASISVSTQPALVVVPCHPTGYSSS